MLEVYINFSMNTLHESKDLKKKIYIYIYRLYIYIYKFGNTLF